MHTRSCRDAALLVAAPSVFVHPVSPNQPLPPWLPFGVDEITDPWEGDGDSGPGVAFLSAYNEASIGTVVILHVRHRAVIPSEV